MEELKSSYRPFNPREQTKTDGSGKPTYYRVTVTSDISSQLPRDDNNCLFNIQHLFPNNRSDMLNGDWRVFLESMTIVESTSYTGQTVVVCLPDLCHSSQNYVLLEGGLHNRVVKDTAIAHVPLGLATLITPSDDALVAVREPTFYARHVTTNDVGVSVDVGALFSGHLRVELRQPAGRPFQTADHGRDAPWTATFLFCYKPK
jgi:hypothetical protein